MHKGVPVGRLLDGKVSLGVGPWPVNRVEETARAIYAYLAPASGLVYPLVAPDEAERSFRRRALAHARQALRIHVLVEYGPHLLGVRVEVAARRMCRLVKRQLQHCTADEPLRDLAGTGFFERGAGGQ